MKDCRLSFCLYLLLILSAQSAWADNTELYIGIEKNRHPYTYLDTQLQAQGLLVDSIRSLCDHAKMTCHFVADDFDTLLEDVQLLQLNALMVIDSFIDPDIDQLGLTSPLCQLESVVLQQASAKPRKEIADFRSTTIGVREGSLLHLYLLDEYSSVARLRPYSLLENGVFDLYTGRIDALFMDEAFYHDRVLATILNSQSGGARLIKLPVTSPELPAISMRLAVRNRDTDLLQTLEKAIKDNNKGAVPECTSLIASTEPVVSDATPPAKP